MPRTIGSCVQLQRGTTYKSALLGQPGPVLLGLASIERNGGFRSDSLRTYGGESPEKLLLRPGDLFVSLKDVTQSADLLGAVARVPPSVSTGRLTQDTVKLILTGEISGSYLYWLLRTPQYRRYCKERGIGTTNLSLARNDFLAFDVPELTESRRATVELLDALDDKIAVNDRIARTADSLREALFSVANSSDDVIDLPLSSLANFVNGRNFTKNATGSGRMVIRIAELGSGPGGSTVYNDVDASDQYVARPGHILFSWSGTLKVARWCRSEALINQHIFKVIPNSGVPAWMVHDLIAKDLPGFRAIAADKATTMGHIQRRHLDKLVRVPSRELWEPLNRTLGALWQRALAADEECLMLAELRDTLLPKLISGELRIKDAERVVSDAV